MILLLRYQNLSASNVAFVITVETLPALIKIILFKAKANNNVIIMWTFGVHTINLFQLG
jgi:hypothetical protein